MTCSPQRGLSNLVYTTASPLMASGMAQVLPQEGTIHTAKSLIPALTHEKGKPSVLNPRIQGLVVIGTRAFSEDPEIMETLVYSSPLNISSHQRVAFQK